MLGRRRRLRCSYLDCLTNAGNMWNSRPPIPCQFAALPTAISSGVIDLDIVLACRNRIKKHACPGPAEFARIIPEVSEVDGMCAAIREEISHSNTCLQLFDSAGYYQAEVVCSSLARQLLQDWGCRTEEDSVRFRVRWMINCYRSSRNCFSGQHFGLLVQCDGSSYDPVLEYSSVFSTSRRGAGRGLRQERVRSLFSFRFDKKKSILQLIRALMGVLFLGW
jgi:hypothetical protein